MNIRGKEVDFKISRIKDASAMEMALKCMEKEEQELQEFAKKNSSTAEFFRRYVNLFKNFFEKTTGVDVLEGCEDVMEAKETYYKFLRDIKGQKEKIVKYSLEDIE